LCGYGVPLGGGSWNVPVSDLRAVVKAGKLDA
jgi:hypothetical protein